MLRVETTVAPLVFCKASVLSVSFERDYWRKGLARQMMVRQKGQKRKKYSSTDRFSHSLFPSPAQIIRSKKNSVLDQDQLNRPKIVTSLPFRSVAEDASLASLIG